MCFLIARCYRNNVRWNIILSHKDFTMAAYASLYFIWHCALKLSFPRKKRSVSFKKFANSSFKIRPVQQVSRLLLHGMAKFTIQRGFFSVWELLSGTNYRRVHCVLSPKTARPKPRFAAPKGHIVFCCLL